MVEHGHQETARTTSGVKYTGVLVGIEHLHHTLDDVARGEELTSLLFQCVAHNGFVSRTLHINRSIKERILCQLCCHESKATVGKHNLLRTVKDITEHLAFFQFFKKATNAVGHSLAALFGKLFFHTYPKTATVTDTFFGIHIATLFIVEFAENEVQQFPKGRLLHTLIAIDVVVAALECLDKRLIGRLTRHGTVALSFKVGKRLAIGRKVRNVLGLSLTKVIFRIIAIMQVLTIGPAAKLTVCESKDIVEHGIHALLCIGGLHLCILSHHHKANQILYHMRLASVKNSQINRLSPTLIRIRFFISHPKITFHVFRGKSIFFSHHINHRLKCEFFICSFHNLIGECTNQLVIFQYQLVFFLCIIYRSCLLCHNLQNYCLCST